MTDLSQVLQSAPHSHDQDRRCVPDPRILRQAFGQFATGVCIVAAQNESGERFGATVNSFTSVSLSPALLLVCVSRRMWSHDAIMACDGFAISVLHAHQDEVSNAFAKAGTDKWRDISYDTGAHGGIIIRPSLAHFDCRTFDRHEGGDHTILVGEVQSHSERHDGSPLLYFRGGYAALHPSPPAPSNS